MKLLCVFLLGLGVGLSLSAAPDMGAIREALSVEVMNSSERISYKPIYKEIKSILQGEDSQERKVCVELLVKAFCEAKDPFTFKNYYERRLDCMGDRAILFSNLFSVLRELRSDKALCFKLARRLGELQTRTNTEGVQEMPLRPLNIEGFNLDILSYRTIVLFAFENAHSTFRLQMPQKDLETFVQEFIAAARMNEREISDYTHRVLGRSYKSLRNK